MTWETRSSDKHEASQTDQSHPRGPILLLSHAMHTSKTGEKNTRELTIPSLQKPNCDEIATWNSRENSPALRKYATTGRIPTANGWDEIRQGRIPALHQLTHFRAQLRSHGEVGHQIQSGPRCESLEEHKCKTSQRTWLFHPPLHDRNLPLPDAPYASK